jgi:hypothetical protein
VLKANWLWDLPGWKSGPAVMRAIVNGWQMSGIFTASSGAPTGVTFTTVNALDITGSPTDSPRIDVTANPVLPRSERTFDRYFNTSVFAVPAVGTYGNAARTLLRGPGIHNWDLTAYKNFSITERLRAQLRGEFYNAFNHTQWSTLDTAARFDAQGRQVNTQFGQVTATRPGRRIQLALRVVF